MLWFGESNELIQQLSQKTGELHDRRNAAGGQLKARLALASHYLKEQLLPVAYDTPITLQMELTYACNLKCVMCYNNSGLGQKRPPELTDDQWYSVAEEACKNGLLEAIVSGGEPFLRKELVFRLLDLFRNYGVQVDLITNGFYVTPEVAGRLSEYAFGFVQVSIDGHTAAIHDRVRGVSGSWERATRALESLASRGICARLAHTCVKFSYKHIAETIDLAIGLGARTVIVGRVIAQGRGSASKAEEELLLDDREELEYWRICEQVRAEKSRYIQFMYGHDSAHSLVESQLQPNWAVVVRPNGDARIGCVAPFVFGNVAEQSLVDIWRNGINRAYRHPEVMTYIREVINEGELAAVRRLHLSAAQESKRISFGSISTSASEACEPALTVEA
jgi:MoaA/NifB/PqqE/SkfB family radical SAM enzyme